MTDEMKLKMMETLAKSGVSVSQLIMENNGTVTYNENRAAEERRKDGAAGAPTRDAIIDYVNRLMPVVAIDYREEYSKIWQDILEEEVVSSVVYDRGRQKGTVFNRNLVAQISRMMLLDGIIVKETNDVRMAELLEPEKGKDHPVRNQLGMIPDDRRIKKAVEEVFKRHGVKV